MRSAVQTVQVYRSSRWYLALYEIFLQVSEKYEKVGMVYRKPWFLDHPNTPYGENTGTVKSTVWESLKYHTMVRYYHTKVW